ncbi:MAG: serine/threonine-protein kinase [Verrucomicrobiota bacterium]
MTDPLPTANCPDCGVPLPPESPQALCASCLMRQALASRTMVHDGGHAAHLPPPSPEEIADKFPGYEILECLGRGGMGVVYKARQKSLNRLVAIKILAPERVDDGRFAERFTIEAELLAKLSHPHIVTIHDFGETAGLFYLVMEFIDGVNLRDLLRDGKIEPEQALAIVPPICDALQYAHDKGIVHRDIKPENLLLDREGRIKIADFGIAKLIGTVASVYDRRWFSSASEVRQTDATINAGTIGYSAPEQASDPQHVDQRADIYSLGVVLYEMLTGERPNNELVAPSKKVQIDVRLDEIVLRALERTPALRYQTAGEFRTMVETMAEPLSVAGSSDSSNPPPPRLKKRVSIGRLIVGCTLFGLLITVLVALGTHYFLRVENYSSLPDSPQKLRLLPSATVFHTGMAKPQMPWAWRELESRVRDGRIGSTEANQMVDDLAAWLRRDYPNGYEQPLYAIGDLLNEMHGRQLVGESNTLAFLVAYCGSPTIERLPRVRENEEFIWIPCNWRSPWFNHCKLRFELLNELHSVSIDGRPVSVPVDSGNHQVQQWAYTGALRLAALAPGKHIVRCEVKSALVALPDMAGLAGNAPSKEWPPAKHLWTRSCEAELLVYAKDAELVRLTDVPAFDPVGNGSVKARPVIIRTKGGRPTAIVLFDMDVKPGFPVSVDVALRLAGQTVQCGNLSAVKTTFGSYQSPTEFAVEIGPVEALIHEAEIVLTPNPKAVESNPDVDRIWGKEITLSHVLLSRQDLTGVYPEETPPTFESVSDAAGKLISKYFPDAVISSKGDEFTATYATREYEIHGQSKTGEVAPEAKKETGPTRVGFVLTVRRQNEMGQAKMPQFFDRPYWKTYANLAIDPKTGLGVAAYFDFGAGLNPEFKAAMLELLSLRVP